MRCGRGGLRQTGGPRRTRIPWGNTINILLLGSGGREHALAAKLAESPRCGELYVAPGNGGTLAVGENVALDENDPAAGGRLCPRAPTCGLVVIGPEAPLVAGVADAVRAAGIPCFGPGAAGAQMEGSKKFSKELMARAGIPTAAYGALYRRGVGPRVRPRAGCAPAVVKADGLAAGKGVVVALDARRGRGRPCAPASPARLAPPAPPW